VVRLRFANRVARFEDRPYSDTSHNLRRNSKNGIIYSRENALFEVRYPNKDITGVAK